MGLSPTVGNKTDIVLERPQARAARSGRAQSQQRSTPPPHEPEFSRVGPRRAAGPSARLAPEAEERRHLLALLIDRHSW
ncbi:MAG TPA: hypothetical protein VGF39_13735 [Stellaceae bacterium]